MKLLRPIRTNKINQKFGENKNPLYAKLGMKGHNGIDFACQDGEPLYWNCTEEGRIYQMGFDYYGGIYLEVLTEEGEEIFKHTYYHLKGYAANLKVGDKIKIGDLLAYCDNTGAGTTGTHLHGCEIKRMGKDTYGNYYKKEPNNGFLGATDPSPYFVNEFVLDYKKRLENLKEQESVLKKMVELYKKLIEILSKK